MGARLYDPVIGRFTSTDPVAVPFNTQGTNSYAYAWNNPTRLIDPFGLLTWAFEWDADGNMYYTVYLDDVSAYGTGIDSPIATGLDGIVAAPVGQTYPDNAEQHSDHARGPNADSVASALEGVAADCPHGICAPPKVSPDVQALGEAAGQVDQSAEF